MGGVGEENAKRHFERVWAMGLANKPYRSKFLGGWHIGCYSDLQVWIPPTLVHSPPSQTKAHPRPAAPAAPRAPRPQ